MQSRWAVCALCALAWGLGACQTREIGQTAPSAPGERKLVAQDDFSAPTLGRDWSRGKGEGGKGKWKVVAGELRGQNMHNDPLWWKRPLPERVRVEFTARALAAEGDLKVEIFGDGDAHASGYVLIFGGWDNSLDVIARLDEHGKDRLARKALKAQPGKTYAMAVERDGSTVRWYVDGALHMSYEDAAPLVGPRHSYFAFNDWEAPVAFDDFKVFELTGTD